MDVIQVFIPNCKNYYICCFREFLGLLLSGVIEDATDWPWAMTFYALGSLACILTILIIKGSEVTMQCYTQKNNSKVYDVEKSSISANSINNKSEEICVISNS